MKHYSDTARVWTHVLEICGQLHHQLDHIDTNIYTVGLAITSGPVILIDFHTYQKHGNETDTQIERNSS